MKAFLLKKPKMWWWIYELTMEKYWNKIDKTMFILKNDK